MTPAEAFEQAWWGTCVNTYGEETKQITYAHRMGMVSTEIDGHWPVYDLKGKSILDLGGGPASLLLKCVNGGRMVVVDPGEYPAWTVARYNAHHVLYLHQHAETVQLSDRFDEAWIYNVLQHVVDPEAVVKTARRRAKLLRIFEWIDQPTNVGHPHSLRALDLERWCGGYGTKDNINENSAVGRAFYGVFR